MIIKKIDKASISKHFSFFEKIAQERLLYILLPILFFSLGYYLAGSSVLKSQVRKIASINREYIKDYVIGQLSHPPKIQIDIKLKNFQHLAFKRQQALERGYLISEDDSYVPARITSDGVTAKIHIRLKGEELDHLQGKKWSYRIKVLGNKTIRGMRFFSLQSPERSGWTHEWVLYRWFKKEGLIALRYDFVELILNGKSMGIYTLEESFSKELIENNKRREGPILKFDDDYFADRGKTNNGDALTEADKFYASDITAFSTKKTFTDDALRNSYLISRGRLEAVRDKTLPLSDVIDVDQAAKVIAILQISNVLHGMRWKNCRFYANPVTQKLELIAYNAFSSHPIVPLDRAGHIFYDWITADMESDGPFKWLHLFMSDETFLAKYFKALDEFTNPEYLNAFFKEIKGELAEKESYVFKDYPRHKTLISNYYYNSRILRNFLYSRLPLKAAVQDVRGERMYLYVANTAFLPVVIDGILDKKTGQLVGTITPDRISPDRINGKITGKPLKYETVECDLTGIDYASLDKNKVGDLYFLDRLQIQYHVLGLSHTRTAMIEAFPILIANIENRKTLSLPDQKRYPGINVDLLNKTVRFAEGDYNINKDMVVPQGYQLILDPGVILSVDQSAVIISYGAVTINGTADKKVEIRSGDGTGQGLCVISAGAPSFWQNVVFDNLGSVNRKTWQLTGAVTIYESEIDINNMAFKQNHAEDQLNIVRSPFKIRNAVFSNSHADSLDFDFCSGTIYGIEFYDSGNDCLDFSGSDVTVDHLKVIRAGDKGISVGERSQVWLKNAVIAGAKNGIAAKDLSMVEIDNVRITHCDIGISAYQKKREYGGAKIDLNNVSVDTVNHRYIRDNDSRITENGQEVYLQPMRIRETGEIDDSTAKNENGAQPERR